jgi:glucose-6-phosphate-specific signal transduction histidine kinase
MKKSFQWVLIANLLTVVLIVLSQVFSHRSTGSALEESAMSMLLLALLNIVAGIFSGVSSTITPKLKPFIGPFLLTGLLLFLVGFSLCTASFKIDRIPTTNTAAPASAH